MSYLDPIVLDRGLEELLRSSSRLTVHTDEPAGYTTAVAGYLGQRIFPVIVGPAASGSGRKVTVQAITDGVVSIAGNAAFWAILDDANQRMLACAPLANPLDVLVGNAFTTTEFDIVLPGMTMPGV